MLQQFSKQQHSQILVDPVKESDISKYGIAKLASTQMVAKSEQNQSFAVTGFVENPKLRMRLLTWPSLGAMYLIMLFLII